MKAVTRRLIYIGPPHAEHPALGPLVAGQPYQVDRELADYWLAQSPEHWKDGAPAPTPKASDLDKE